jgi:uncharacterized protein (TIGR02271 family)
MNPDTNLSADNEPNKHQEGQPLQDLTVIPVIEEQVSISKRLVETGKVTIVKQVHEEQQQIDVPIVRENVRVERVTINQYVDAPPSVRQEGDTMIIPVLREVIVTQKKLLLVEEVHVTKERVEENDVRQVTLRQEEVHINRTSDL